MNNALHIVASCLVLVLLTCVVGLRLLYVRAIEMRRNRIHPQAVSTSLQVATTLKNVQAADNFRNLFEVPVLFYALVAMSLATAQVPAWLVFGAWSYVALRIAHSAIHCTYINVMHRFAVFGASFAVLVALWVSFFITLSMKSA
ncbi:MAG: MAPEG family protein [Tahibacter sp.]